MSFRSCRRSGWAWAVAVACVLALTTIPAVAGPARVTPSDLDGPGGLSKTLARVPVIAAGTDVKNLTTLATFATIQAAIDDPGTLDGHVLEVQAETHAESIVTVHKGVTIQGGGSSGVSIITPIANTGSSGDARAWFLVTASGVTFQNLTFDGTGKAIQQALRFNAPGGLVERCAFTHIRYSQYLGMGIVSFYNLTVDDCDFSDIERLGVIVFGSGVTTSTVSNCTFTGKGDGDWIDYGVELGGGAIASLSNNTITNCTGVALSDGSNSAGVLVTDLYGPGTRGTIGNNFITGNTVGVAIGYLDTDMSVVIAHENDLSGNGTGTASTNAAQIADCSANWWGSIDPATVAASAGPGIDYTPWLHVGTDMNATAGFQGGFSALHVDDSSPQTGIVLRIAEAIGLVSGSTVYLAPGNYPGNVVIDKKLTLQGSGDGADPGLASILLPPAGTVGILIQAGGTGATDRCEIRDLRVVGGNYGLRIDNVLAYLTLQNLTITEAGVYGFEIHNIADITDLVMTDVDLIANASIGMRVRGKLNGLTMTNGHVDGNVYGLQSVTGVGEGNNFVNVAISGTTFDNNASKGIYLEKLSDAVFDGISVVNSGTAGSWAAGIDINLKFADYQNVEIRNSTISNCGTGDPVNGVGITIKARTDGSTYGANPATLTNVDLLANTITGCQNGIRFGEPGKSNPGPTVVDVHENQITASVGVGLDNASLTTTNANCNWWGSALGPDVPPGNPSPGDGITGSATYAAWWTTATGPCDGWGANNIAAVPDTCISSVHPCETVDMLFTRADPTPMRGYSITFHLSPELVLCGTPTASILAGPYLASGAGANGTVFQVVDNGGGSYTVDEAILGTPCGAIGSGVLFRVRVTTSGLDGTGTISVGAVTVRDCFNVPLPGTPGAPGTVAIDNTVPAAVADLAATQLRNGNDTDGTTKIQLTFTPPSDAAAVEIYRAGFGQHPEYDDNGGAEPALPSYPPGPPWSFAGTFASGQYDEIATRDFLYFVAFAVDSCGNAGAVSNKTTGTLNYHLGDVSTGLANCAGDNDVFTEDISLLGAHYAITLAPNDTYNCLDVGPTTTSYIDGRPLTDNRVQFEDLILFAINFGEVSKSIVTPAPAASDEIAVLVPEGWGDEILARLWVRGSGRVQGVSVQLAWNPAVVEPVGGIEAGDLLRDQGGVAFQAAQGGVDAALLGVRDHGLSGEGCLATVRFRVVGDGDPAITVATVDARSARNEPIDLQSVSPADLTQAAPRVTQLLPNVPNPFNPSTRIAFTLAERGPVELAIFTVSGQRVRTLVHEVRGAGLNEAVWNGTDDAGRRLASGVYRMRLVTPDGARSRPIVMLK